MDNGAGLVRVTGHPISMEMGVSEHSNRLCVRGSLNWSIQMEVQEILETKKLEQQGSFEGI